MKLSMARVSMDAGQIPDVLQDLLARNRRAAVADQIAQQIRLHERQLEGAAGGAQLERPEVHGAAVELERRLVLFGGRRSGGLRLARPGAPAQQAVDARQQDGEIERLGQIVVRAALESVAAHPPGD